MTEQDEQRVTCAAMPMRRPMLSPAAWVRVLPFLTYVVFIIVGDLLARLGVSAAALRWLYPVKIGAVALLLAAYWGQYTELRQTRPGARVTLVALAVGAAVFAFWILLDAHWMMLGSASGFDPRDDGQLDWTLVALRLGGAMLVVPVMEELFWRSFLLRWIESSDFQKVDPSQPGPKSFAITIALFGIEHNLWLAGIVAGAAYSALFMRHRTLWSPILAHAVTNGLLGIWVVATGNWSYW
jgi:hypothetical protein